MFTTSGFPVTIELSLFAWAFIATAIIDVTVAIVLWRRGAERGARIMAVALLALAEWILCDGIEVSIVGDIPLRVLFSKLSYLGVYVSIPLFLQFVLIYTWNENWLRRIYYFLMWLIPLVMIGLVATNDFHGLIWSGYHMKPDTTLNILVYERGAFYWLGVAYVYAVLILVTLLLVQAIYRLRHIYRRQVVIILISFFFPWLINLNYLISRGPSSGIDLTGLGFSATGFILFWGIFRFRLLDLHPIARDVLFEKIGDCIIVLDARMRVVDINQAAIRVLGRGLSSAVGLPAASFLGRFPALLDRLNNLEGQRFEINYNEETTFNLEADVTPLRNPAGQADGWLIMLRDISARKRAEQQIISLYRETQRRLKEQSILNRVNQIVSSTLNMDEMVNFIYQQVKSLVDTPSFLVASYDPENDLFSATVINEVEGLQRHTFSGQSYLQENNQPLFLRNLQQIESFIQEMGKQPFLEGVKCIMSVPLIAKGTLVGVMSIWHDHLENAFNDEDFALFFSISSQIAIAFENARLFEMSERLATIDSLTGIANRRHFFTLGANEIERAIRYQRPLSVIMMDLDFFKTVNDRFGHAVGDRALQVIAQLCTQALRSNDIFGRYGGEEFAVLLPETEMQGAYIVAERIRQLVAEASYTDFVDGSLNLTVSMGVAALNGNHLSLDELLEAADSALLRAKREGRNQVRMA